MKALNVIVASVGLLGLSGVVAVPAMAGITPEQEAAQLDIAVQQQQAAQQATQGGAEQPYAASPNAFNGAAQRRIQNAVPLGESQP